MQPISLWLKQEAVGLDFLFNQQPHRSRYPMIQAKWLHPYTMHYHKNVMTSAAEAETAQVYNNINSNIPIRHTLT